MHGAFVSLCDFAKSPLNIAPTFCDKLINESLLTDSYYIDICIQLKTSSLSKVLVDLAEYLHVEVTEYLYIEVMQIIQCANVGLCQHFGASSGSFEACGRAEFRSGRQRRLRNVLQPAGRRHPLLVLSMEQLRGHERTPSRRQHARGAGRRTRRPAADAGR